MTPSLAAFFERLTGEVACHRGPRFPVVAGLPGHLQVVRGPLETGAEPGQDVEVAGAFAVRDLVERPLEQVHELVRRRGRELLGSRYEPRVERDTRRAFEDRRGAEASRGGRKKVDPDP